MGKWFGFRSEKDKRKQELVESLEEKIDLDQIPKHIAIIMDGNGRWATSRGLPRAMGHRSGVESIRQIVKTCSSLGVKYLTVYSFSTENWRRPLEEVSILMELLVEYLRNELNELHLNNVRVNAIGKLSELPEKPYQALKDAMSQTQKNSGLVLNLALNYGGRDEIIEAVKKIVAASSDPIEINEKNFSKYLYTHDIPDPDLLIRPSGELRISNFLLWQIAYTEFWFTSVLWPDFRKEHLLEAIFDYQQRQRRFGGLK